RLGQHPEVSVLHEGEGGPQGSSCDSFEGLLRLDGGHHGLDLVLAWTVWQWASLPWLGLRLSDGLVVYAVASPHCVDQVVQVPLHLARVGVGVQDAPQGGEAGTLDMAIPPVVSAPDGFGEVLVGGRGNDPLDGVEDVLECLRGEAPRVLECGAPDEVHGDREVDALPEVGILVVLHVMHRVAVAREMLGWLLAEQLLEDLFAHSEGLPAPECLQALLCRLNALDVRVGREGALRRLLGALRPLGLALCMDGGCDAPEAVSDGLSVRARGGLERGANIGLCHDGAGPF